MTYNVFSGTLSPTHFTSISENLRTFDACIVINDKSQGSVATHLRCGELFSNYFTTDLLLSLLVKQFLKSVNIWQSYRQEVTNTITYHVQKHFAAISFLLHRSRCDTVILWEF